MKTLFFILLVWSGFACKAQKIDSIYINLYTDSLKKGTYNYINVDGLLANGTFIPLDSSHISFKSNYGNFYGNSLFIDSSITAEKVAICVTLRSNADIKKSFSIYIKNSADKEYLKTEQELLYEMRQQGKRKKRN